MQLRKPTQWKGFNSGRRALNWLATQVVADGREHPDDPLPPRRSPGGLLPKGYRYYAVADSNTVHSDWDTVNSLKPRYYCMFNDLQKAHEWLQLNQTAWRKPGTGAQPKPRTQQQHNRSSTGGKPHTEAPAREYKFYAAYDVRGCGVYTTWSDVQLRPPKQWKGFDSSRRALNWLATLAVADGREHPDDPLPPRRSPDGLLYRKATATTLWQTPMRYTAIGPRPIP